MWYFGWLFITAIVIVLTGAFIDARVPETTYCMSGTKHRSGLINWFTFWSQMILFVSAIVWMIGFLSLKSYPQFFCDTYEATIKSEKTYIKSAALDSEIHGEFVVGCGSIDQEDVYKFYEILNSAGTSYKTKTLPTKYSRIQELPTDSLFRPYVVTYYYVGGISWHGWFVRAFWNRPAEEHFEDIKVLKEHVIYVPAGTIVSDLSKLNL